MQRTCVIVTALTLLGSVPSTAQSNPTSTGSSNTTTEITPEQITPAQRTLIKRYASQHYTRPVRLERMIPAGGTVPNHVEFEPMPAPIVRQHPHLKDFGYFASDTGTYIVDPHSQKVI